MTEADRRAEAVLLELLRAERPDDGVLGEEGAAVAGGARRWLLDPVDGTLNYALGLPAWCSAVALVDADGAARLRRPRPGRGELFSAARGAGAALDGAPLRVGARRSARRRVATFVDVRRRDAEIAAGTDALLRRIGALRAVGCGSLELAWVAAGGCTAGSRPTSSRGTGIRARCWSPRRAARSRSRGRWHVAAASAALRDALLAVVAFSG